DEPAGSGCGKNRERGTCSKKAWGRGRGRGRGKNRGEKATDELGNKRVGGRERTDGMPDVRADVGRTLCEDSVPIHKFQATRRRVEDDERSDEQTRRKDSRCR